MWRAGWKGTDMAHRYVHSGAELEKNAHLEKMGYVVEEKKTEKILPKTCPFCKATNPYTNTKCDLCDTPLDPKECQDEIDNEKRANSGKGFRAIYLSAFMIGVLQYCVKKGLKYPRFLVLDSPLTAYKGAEIGKGQEDEKIGEDLQDLFYESLANLPYLDRVQILIVENKDPPAEITKKPRVTYEHFTGNVNLPPRWFLPRLRIVMV